MFHRHVSPTSDDPAPSACVDLTQLRLTAIEDKLLQVEGLLNVVHRFNGQLEQVSTTLAVAMSLLAQEATSERIQALPSSPGGNTAEFQVVTHIRRDGHGTRLVTDVSWPDLWSVRLFATAMLRTLAQSSLVTDDCRCWCEVWRPDESGEIVDSAYLQSDTVTVEWESDLLDSQ